MSKIFKHRIINVTTKDLIKTLDHLSLEGTEVVTTISSLDNTHQIVVKDVLRERNERKDLNEEKHRQFAENFYNRLKKHKQILGTQNPQNKSWVDPIRLLEIELGLEDNKGWKMMVLAATHYFNNIGDEFLPVIQSTSAFRKKFQQLHIHAKRNKK